MHTFKKNPSRISINMVACDKSLLSQFYPESVVSRPFSLCNINDFTSTVEAKRAFKSRRERVWNSSSVISEEAYFNLFLYISS